MASYGGRMGGERVAELVAALERDPPELAFVADQLLEHYYDGMYNHQAKVRGGHTAVVDCNGGDAHENARTHGRIPVHSDTGDAARANTAGV